MEEEKRNTILVIEDDPDVRTMIVKHLKHQGFDVVTAKDGMQGLKKLKAGGYDLVITDIVMPYVSGTGLVTALKESKSHIPVIAITGYGEEPEAVATEKKADLVLSKPVMMSELKEHISRLLNLSEQENQSA
jgi:DNA-binding response OmpR family regulator